VDKDKQSAAGTTVNAVTATATAGVNASPGAAASPLQNSSQAGGAAAAAPQAGSVGQTDQARFLQRVTAAFQSVGDRSGSVRIMLSPPELGSLRLEVSIQNGTLSAHLQAETPAARNLLLDNLPALRDRLAGQNIKVDRFDVDLMDRQPQGGTSGQTSYQSNTNSQGSYRGNSSGGSARGSVGSVGSVATAAASAPDSPVVETTRLNVVV
jgi:flagellar hook-length control protein FliK